MRIKTTNTNPAGICRFSLLLIFFCIISVPLFAQFAGGNGDGFAVSALGSSGGEIPLPITLVLFNAQDDVDSVKLIWETATETNNDHFTVEKSTNGNDWALVKTVKGLGNSTAIHFYEAFDENPFSGLSYYHLKQTDYDGKSTFSKMESIYRGISSEGFSVFPNPTRNVLTVNVKKQIGMASVSIYSAYGQLVWSSFWNTSLKEEEESIDVSSLKAGWYFIRLYSLPDRTNSFAGSFIKTE
jgi:hypothetical protein